MSRGGCRLPRSHQSGEPREWSRSTTWAVLAAALLVALGTLAFLAPLTPQLTFNHGLGYFDGQTYAALVNILRGQLHTEVATPYVYRIAPIAFVAWSGLPPVSGLLLVNVAGGLLSAPLLVLLMRRYRVPPTLALVAVAWLCTLGPGLRLTLYYPTLLDGIGQALILALLACAVYGRFALFATLLPIALLTRENALITLPFLWLANMRCGILRSGVATFLAAITGILALALVHAAPPIAPTNGTSALADAQQNLAWFAANASDRAWRYLIAPPLTLGLLVVVPFLAPRVVWSWLRDAPEWVWLVAGVLGLAMIGGGDYDRFAYGLAPPLLIASFVALASLHLPAVVLAALTALQMVAIGFGYALGPGESSYRSWTVALMDFSGLAERMWRFGAAALAALAFPRMRTEVHVQRCGVSAMKRASPSDR